MLFNLILCNSVFGLVVFNPKYIVRGGNVRKQGHNDQAEAHDLQSLCTTAFFGLANESGMNDAPQS